MRCGTAAPPSQKLNFGPTAREKRNNKENQEHHEQELCDPCSGPRNPSESKDRGDDGDDQKDNGVVEHKNEFLPVDNVFWELHWLELSRLKQGSAC
jgi:hypothetical protein